LYGELITLEFFMLLISVERARRERNLETTG